MEAPQRDEAELSAFGPGYGESLLVHLGEGQWMLVDSCVKAGRLPALDYLEELGVDPAEAVTLLVATHWHDDHVRGMAEALKRCRAAKFACSVALNRDELVAAIGRQPPGRFGSLTSGVEEMRNVLEYLVAGKDRSRLMWVGQSRSMCTRVGDLACNVQVLAPCDAVVTEAFGGIAELADSGTETRVPKPDRNVGAVVLWVEVGDATMLLGSDLQETPDDETGWTAVIGVREGIDRRSEIFKVPHHGSKNAHQDLVWRKLLIDQPEAVVCPHELGANQLPTPSDLGRLCALANVHLTAPPRRSMIRRGRPGRLAVPDFGRVTLRRRVGSQERWEAMYAAPAGNGCAN